MASCCKCLFIEQADFYGRVPLPTNVDDENIQIAIQNTQKKYIEPLFCEALYEEICEEVNLGYFTPINEELLCYIKDIHVRYAFADFLFLQPVRVTKESVVRKVSNESEFVDFDTIQKHAQYWRMEAENYVKDLKNFLKDNITSNALYANDCHTCDEDFDSEDWGFLP